MLNKKIFFLILSSSVHDESTFGSGEVSSKRWIYNNQAPFYSKGRGRSYMISDFLVMHQSGPFFQLSAAEYQNALLKYPELDEEDDIDYVKWSATGSICVGGDVYFDNASILTQFERLFKLLEFKQCFRNHRIEIIVDNARTHSARSYSLSDFGKSIGTRCPVDNLEWIDNDGEKQSLSCYFQKGPDRGKSKGLLQIAQELDLNHSPRIKLNELHCLLSRHPAFQHVMLFKHLGNFKSLFRLSLGITVGTIGITIWNTHTVLSQISL